MLDSAFRRTGPHFILLMMLASRVFAIFAGCLCIYYVHLGIKLEPAAFRHFVVTALIVTVLAAVITALQALYETRHLRRVLHILRSGRQPAAELARRGAREAFTFPAVHAGREAITDPWYTIVPICATLAVLDDVSVEVLLQVFFAGFLGLSCIILGTFFLSQRCMAPVIEYLLRNGIEVDFEALPKNRLSTRLQVGFGIVILTTAVMIGALANQRALEIIRNPETRVETVASLRNHTIFISLAAVAIAVGYSHLLAQSVSIRVGRLVAMMKRVQAGEFSHRLYPSGNDEIDMLTRQFNSTVGELEHKDKIVRDLNANLERKVRDRTTELARSKRSLQESLKKLRESDRHKTEFFSNVSHELRTPLTMILSPLEQLARQEGDRLSEKSRSLVDVATVNGHRLLKLINQLLDFAKLEAGHSKLHPTPVNVNCLVSRLVAAAVPLAEGRGVQLSVRLEEDLKPITADEEKLDAVVTNLLSNALKFTPRGGSVTVSTSLCSGGDSVFAEDQVRVAVEDTGIGIAPENLDKLFQRFVQVDGSTSRAFAGTGLGLALVKEFVELHGGQVSVESEPDRGSCFSFTLPAVKPSVEISGFSDPGSQLLRPERFADLMEYEPKFKGKSEQTPADNAGAARILVVDDTPDIRHLLGEILQEHYKVTFAEDGQAGWESVQNDPPDLILSDVMMPGVDGRELCRLVKENPETAAIPFVLLTARAGMSMKLEGLNIGADDYLVKPFNSEELLARVRSLLRLRRMHTDLASQHKELEATVAELRETRDQLVQSEKMNSLGHLVAGLAHEINNSINAVSNGVPAIIQRTQRLERLVEAALHGEDDPEAASAIADTFQGIHRLAGVVEEGAQRTAGIVGDMKRFSHPGKETQEVFDLNHALELCVDLLSKQHREKVAVHCEFGDVGTIRGSYGKLNQVFLNLLANAAQAMPHGGEIYVTTALEGDHAVVSIRDTGTGIPEEIRSRIFDPFFTTKPPGQGTGLGLSVSYGVVTGMGGTIDCHSVEGVGTEFIIRLPNTVAPSAGASSPQPALESVT
ncbi:MAG: response regulator [Planctomycetota bacterium]|nr:MAG: response regulator [Planctomycetota bacterium]REK23401.1 MAG: response regulator [Planctomycetota bacterium]REK38962.1 MAG: response regulator [Planctomycetota bacterium]